MNRAGFGSPLLFSAMSLIGALLIASTYLYTAFVLTTDAPSSRSELEKQGLSEEQIESTLRDENEKRLEKYLPADEIEKIKKQELDSGIKNDIGFLATYLQAFYTTPGNGKYPSSLSELITSGFTKEIPQTPSGENYQYVVCLDLTESVLFSQLNAENGYWTWSSFEGNARILTVLPTEQNCSSKKF